MAARRAATVSRRSRTKRATSIKVPIQPPRNPLVPLARKRAAGPHGTTRKAERAAAKVRLRKHLPDDDS